MDINLDVTITATRRPDVLRHTLDSFSQWMGFPDGTRCVINIDPIGPGTDKAVISVVKEYFTKYDIYCNRSGGPGLGYAFKFIWERTEAPWVFHLEDDWAMIWPVDLFDMIETMEKHPDLAALRLPAFQSGEHTIKTWNRHIPWSPELNCFEIPKDKRLELGFCGHPSLLRGDFVRTVAPFIDPTQNPEKQFHHGRSKIMEMVSSHRWAIWSRQNGPAAIMDIGREWMVKNGYKKRGNKAHFTNWEKNS